VTSRYVIHRIAGAALVAALIPAMPVWAQSYPSKPIRIVLAVPPGGSVDGLARVVGKYLSAAVGQPVIIDNRPGGSNKIATDITASSPPDGYTLYIMGSSQPQVEASAISSGQTRPFDTLRDLASVATIATNTYALVVHPSVPAKNVKEFIALAKARPGQITYGSSGVAKSDHVAGALLEQMTGIKMLHVPYKGLGDAVREMISGRILACFGALPIMAPHINAGKLRLLGVVSAEKSFQFPDTPTLAEAIPLKGYAVETWIGMMAPVKTPEAIVTRLNTEINKMLRDDAFVKNGLHPIGLGAWPKTPDQMTALIRDDLQKHIKLFKELNIKLE
jgi:tripartite-type tricarboxylate transporter receptor subunit TctC